MFTQPLALTAFAHRVALLGEAAAEVARAAEALGDILDQWPTHQDPSAFLKAEGDLGLAKFRYMNAEKALQGRS